MVEGKEKVMKDGWYKQTGTRKQQRKKKRMEGGSKEG